tara:strand:- start:379 stop:816 length:438 start_codon:yes stop_codon:yes gene_type:complete
MTQNSINKTGSEDGIITPLHRLPLIIIGFGLLLLTLPINYLPGLITAVFGLFLLIQSFTLKVKITSSELIVLQLGKEIRRFPFENWIAWRIFLPKLPGLLYFREKVSPHLLPILFDPEMLEKELKLRVGELEVNSQSSLKNTSEN